MLSLHTRQFQSIDGYDRSKSQVVIGPHTEVTVVFIAVIIQRLVAPYLIVDKGYGTRSKQDCRSYERFLEYGFPLGIIRNFVLIGRL